MMDAVLLNGLSWTLKGSAILLVMMVLAGVLKHKLSASSRYIMVFCGLISFLLIPFIEKLIPALFTVSLPVTPLAASPEMQSALPVGGNGHVTVSPSGIAWHPWWLFFGVWMLGLGVGVLVWMKQLFSVKLLAKTSTPLQDPAFKAQADRIRMSLGIRQPIAVLLSHSIRMPQAWGPPGRMVILPQDALSWSDHERVMILSHEMAHCARWDTVTASVLRLVSILQWFNPIVHWATKQATFHQELAADERALRSGQSPFDYSAALVHFARNLQSEKSSMPMMQLLGKRGLRARIHVLLNSRSIRQSKFLQRFIHSGALMLVLFFGSIVQREKNLFESDPPGEVGLPTDDPLLKGILSTYMANVERNMEPVTSLPDKFIDAFQIFPDPEKVNKKSPKISASREKPSPQKNRKIQRQVIPSQNKDQARDKPQVKETDDAPTSADPTIKKKEQHPSHQNEHREEPLRDALLKPGDDGKKPSAQSKPRHSQKQPDTFYLRNPRDQDLDRIYRALGIKTPASKKIFLDQLRKSQEENNRIVIRRVVRKARR